MWSFEKEVLGTLASMKNGRGFNMAARRSFKKKTALQFEEDFARQVGAGRVPYLGPVLLLARVWYKSPLSDLDVALLCDCLQKANVIANDRQVLQHVTEKTLDRGRPRVWVKLVPAESGLGRMVASTLDAEIGSDGQR